MTTETALYLESQFCDRLTFKATTRKAVSHLKAIASRYGEVTKQGRSTFTVELWEDNPYTAMNAILDFSG